MSDQTASTLKQLVPVAQLVGVTGAAALSGAIGACSYIAVPVVLTAPRDVIAKQWNLTFDIGKATAPPIAIASSLCFGFLASQSTKIAGRYPQMLFDPTSPFALYTAAALAIPAIMPYTLGVMMPSTVNKLVEAADKPESMSEGETKELIQKWSGQNYVRMGFVGFGAVLGAVATYVSYL